MNLRTERHFGSVYIRVSDRLCGLGHCKVQHPKRVLSNLKGVIQRCRGGPLLLLQQFHTKNTCKFTLYRIYLQKINPGFKKPSI